MTAKDKHDDKGSPKKPADKSGKQPSSDDDLYEDGDMATPKRDFNEDEIKDEEDKRL